MTDVLMHQTPDGGEIDITDGVVALSPGLESMAYLCLFGGNEDDDGSDGNPLQWWGNFDETDAARVQRSETQHLLKSIPATSGNLQRIQKAAERDLQVFIDENIATSVDVSVNITALNTVSIVIDISAIDGQRSALEFVEAWNVSITR